MFETFESLPESTTTVKSGKSAYGYTERRAKTRWVLSGTPETQRVVVDLTTSHWPDSKTFGTTVTWSTVEPASHAPGFHVESWGSDHATVHFARTPVARYSKSLLESQHAAAMAHFATHFEQFAQVFAQAAAVSAQPVEV